MTNLFIGPIILLAIAVAGLVSLVRRELREIDLEHFDSTHLSLQAVLQDKINHFYTGFSFFFKQLGHYAYFFSLIIMRRLMIWSKALSIMAEKRFSHLIDSVHGKGVMDKRGAVSLFLSNISKK